MSDPILDKMPLEDGHAFAVIDGALVDGLPHRLRRAGLPHRPLYMLLKTGHGNASGPWLVTCAEDQAIMTLRQTLPVEAMVWWLWPGETAAAAEEEAFRHLRGLGMVEIPQARPGTGLRTASTVEPVLFRHADPGVILDLLLVLDMRQRARFWGKARAIVLDLPRRGGLHRAAVPADLPPRAPGMLRLSPEQIARLADKRSRTRETEIVDYLRCHAGYETARRSDEDLRAMVRDAQARARQFGVQRDAGILKFCFLVAVTGGAILEGPDLEEALTRSGTTADAALDAVMAMLAEAGDLPVEGGV